MKNPLVRIAAAAVVVGFISACSPSGNEPAGASPSASVPAAAPVSVSPAKFTGVIAQIPAAGNCALDVLNGVPVTSPLKVKKTDELTLGGWMANSAGEVPTDAQLVLQGAVESYAFPLQAGGTREDVAAVMKSEALKNSGFELPLALAGAQTGTYDLAIVMGANAYVCPLNIKLDVTD